MISLIIPLYNVEKYITKCLESILAQDLRDFELILVDDGSRDRSVETARSILEGKDLRWQILQKENGGQSSARNLGLKKAIGEYVVFMDSDDVVSPDFLSRLSDAMTADTDFSFCGYRYVKEQIPCTDDDERIISFSKPELIEAFLKRTISFVVPSMMFRRDFLLKNGLFFREEIRYSEDQLFIWEAIFSSERSSYLPRKMYGYYLREHSIMTGSPYDKIVKGYEVYASFCKELEQKYPEYSGQIRLILPRWQLGTLYTSASLMDKDEFCDVYYMMDGKTMISRIAGIGEIKAYALALVCSLSPNLLYSLCRKVDLNG